MAQKRCTVSMDFDHLSAEGIFAVGHSCGPQGIGDQDHAFCSEHGEGGTDHAAVDMDPVADDLGHDLLIIKGRSPLIVLSAISFISFSLIDNHV